MMLFHFFWNVLRKTLASTSKMLAAGGSLLLTASTSTSASANEAVGSLWERAIELPDL